MDWEKDHGNLAKEKRDWTGGVINYTGQHAKQRVDE